MVMGFVGNVSARAVNVPMNATAHANSNDTHRIGFLPNWLYRLVIWIEHDMSDGGAKGRRKTCCRRKRKTARY